MKDFSFFLSFFSSGTQDKKYKEMSTEISTNNDQWNILDKILNYILMDKEKQEEGNK